MECVYVPKLPFPLRPQAPWQWRARSFHGSGTTWASLPARRTPRHLQLLCRITAVWRLYQRLMACLHRTGAVTRGGCSLVSDACVLRCGGGTRKSGGVVFVIDAMAIGDRLCLSWAVRRTVLFLVTNTWSTWMYAPPSRHSFYLAPLCSPLPSTIFTHPPRRPLRQHTQSAHRTSCP